LACTRFRRFLAPHLPSTKVLLPFCFLYFNILKIWFSQTRIQLIYSSKTAIAFLLRFLFLFFFLNFHRVKSLAGFSRKMAGSSSLLVKQWSSIVKIWLPKAKLYVSIRSWHKYVTASNLRKPKKSALMMNSSCRIMR
jgi:hypothetical protein